MVKFQPELLSFKRPQNVYSAILYSVHTYNGCEINTFQILVGGEEHPSLYTVYICAKVPLYDI